MTNDTLATNIIKCGTTAGNIFGCIIIVFLLCLLAWVVYSTWIQDLKEYAKDKLHNRRYTKKLLEDNPNEIFYNLSTHHFINIVHAKCDSCNAYFTMRSKRPEYEDPDLTEYCLSLNHKDGNFIVYDNKIYDGKNLLKLYMKWQNEQVDKLLDMLD